jgi:anti-anti-sigma regulatory factor
MRATDIGEVLSDLARLGVGINVSLDLRNCDVVTASTLGKLVALHRSLRPLGGRIALRNLTPFVLEVFHASRLDALFDIRERPSRRVR